MCWCNPSVRTPRCSKPGCVPPLNVTQPAPLLAPQFAGTCRHCGLRPGSSIWVGEGGALGFAHGGGAWWCSRCVLTEQLAAAKKMAEQVGPLEAALAALKD